MKKIDLTNGKVISVLLTLAIPIMGSSLLQFTYNLIDMLWVGGLGSDAVASIGSSSFFIGLGYSINALVVIGTGIKVAHSIGRKDELAVKQYINAGIVINAGIGVLYAASLIFLGKNFIEFLSLGNINVENQAYLYLLISAPTMIFTFFNLLYTRILGSFGNNKEALKISAIGIIINIILDPICIYVLNLGVVGAALGTLVANVIMTFLFLIKSNGLLRFDYKIGIDFKKIKEIIKLGFPMSMQRILFTLINIILARIIATFGSDAIAAQKIGLQIESITYMVIGGLNGAVSSFTGQNYGSNKIERIKIGYYTALKIGLVYSGLMTLVFLFLNVPIIRLFIREDSAVIMASSYLQIIAFSQIFSTIEMVSNGLFTGIGRPKVPATISIVFTGLRIPMALLFVKYFGVNGIWLSISLSSILKGSVSYLIYKIDIREVEAHVKED